jgi:PAS domain S-box-containing protein
MNGLQRSPSLRPAVPLLLVDDRPSNILALEAVLGSAEHELVVAHSGSDAVRLLKQRDFAVVLLDVQMPHMDGFETASQMKQIAKRGQPAPIIFLTGIDWERARVLRAYAEGGVDFIQKPIEPEILRAKVSVFAELYRARQRLIDAQQNAEEERLRLAREAARREAAETGLAFVRAVIDNLPDLAWTARADGETDFYNQRWLEFTGKTFEEMAGWGWQQVHDPTILPAVVERWRSALASGKPFEMEFPLRGADGAFHWFLTRVRPLRDARGAIVRWVGTNSNVDESRKLREALARAAGSEKQARLEAEAAVTEQVLARQHMEGLRAEAVRAVRTREDLLATVSHDLRNPLSTVTMAATQIERFADATEPGVRTKKAVKAILSAVDRMDRLVRDLLDLARLEAGHALPVDLERHDVMELTREATELLEPLANARQLTLQTDLSASCDVLCDGDRVQQALSNLIGNAIKFTGEGGAIHVRAERTADEVLFSVRDSGAGIPDQQIPHLFTPYWRADARRKDGAGLGLAIVKAIVETHGGRIWVESALGRGSTFYFTLRAADAAPAPQEGQ